MFVDEVTLKIEGGRGGDGKTSFFPGRGGPSGGSGGIGGSVYMRANSQFSSLSKYASIAVVAAPDGVPGGRNRKTGANGLDVILDMPVGTTIIDVATRAEIELNVDGDMQLICRGGIGGLGNDALKSATDRSSRKAQLGKKGEVRNVKVILKLIADYGLVGMPNAGKSTLLNELTAATAKIANYPFTTLEPNLGVLDTRVLADIPGLIEGASQGRGLGIKFLKHIEKVKLLLHCISSESVDVARDYKTVMDELSQYNPEVAKKDSIVLLTKTDLIDVADAKQKLKQLKKLSKHVYPISILDSKSIEELRKLLTA